MAIFSKTKPIQEYEAEGETERIYYEIRQTLRSTGVPDPFCSWAGHGKFLPLAWSALQPNAETRAFEEASDRLRAEAARLLKPMEKIGVRRASFVGHDIGGGVALRMATLFPGRVARLCLMNSISYDAWPNEAMLQLGHPETRRRLSAWTASLLMKQALKRGFAASPSNDRLDGLLVPYATETGKLSLIRDAVALNTNQTMEIVPRLQRITAPTLILWGEGDRFQPVASAERLAWEIPGAGLIRIKQARHFVMLDQPNEVCEHLLPS